MGLPPSPELTPWLWFPVHWGLILALFYTRCLLLTAMIPSGLCPSLVTLGSTPSAQLSSLVLADNFMAGILVFPP